MVILYQTIFIFEWEVSKSFVEWWEEADLNMEIHQTEVNMQKLFDLSENLKA